MYSILRKARKVEVTILSRDASTRSMFCACGSVPSLLRVVIIFLCFRCRCGTVEFNNDDSFKDLLDEPIGSTFIRDEEIGNFIRLED